jgi:hypothetical protein
MQQRSAVPNERSVSVLLLMVWMTVGLGPRAESGTDNQEILRELTGFHLSMEKLGKAAHAGKVLDQLSETEPSLRGIAHLDKKKGLQSIDEAVDRIDANPEARTAIHSAGLSTRDYVLTMYCFVQSTQELFVKEGMGKQQYPPGASEENVVFVRNHLKEINRLFSDKP